MIEKSALGIWIRSNALTCLPESVHQLSAKSIMTMSALLRNRSNTNRLPSGVMMNMRVVPVFSSRVSWRFYNGYRLPVLRQRHTPKPNLFKTNKLFWRNQKVMTARPTISLRPIREKISLMSSRG